MRVKEGETGIVGHCVREGALEVSRLERRIAVNVPFPRLGKDQVGNKCCDATTACARVPQREAQVLLPVGAPEMLG
jgi:hypothetical protein